MQIDNIELALEISATIAKRTPFSQREIFNEWTSFHSFDLILRAIEFSRLFGITSIHEAVNHLIEDFVIEQKESMIKYRGR